MADEIIIETTSAEVIMVGVPGPQGPAGAAGTGLETLTTKGDTLYRGETTGERLPIGTTGQILRVSSSGLPEWGAAPASGVSSVSGKTGAVLLDSTDIFTEQALQISDAGVADCNAVFVYGGVFNNRATYYATKDTFVYWDGSNWVINHNGDDQYFGTATTYPWQAVWSLGDGTNPLPVVTQAASHEFEQVVGQRTNPTARGDAASKNVGTGANDVAAGNHTHIIANVSGLQSALDGKQAAGDYATLVSGTVPSNQLPSFVDDVLEFANLAAFPVTGESGKIYVAIDTRKTYRWSGSTYVEISPSEVTSVAGRTGAITLANTDISGLGTASTRDVAASGNASSTQVVLGNDSRLSDSRTPTAHAAAHAAAGSDPLFDQDLNTTDEVTFDTANIQQLNVTGAIDASAASSIQIPAIQTSVSIFDQASLNTGTFRAEADSLTANRTYDLPDADGKIIVSASTPDDGDTLVWDDTNSAWVAAASTGGGGGVSGVAASAADIFSISGSDIVADDAGSDKIVFWDDSAGKLAYGSVSDVGAAAASHTHTPSEVGLGNVSNTAQVTSVTGTAPIVSSGGTTPAISVTVGTTANTVCAGDDARLSNARTPTAHTHPAADISDSTTAGRALLTGADAAAQRTSLGLGTAATAASTDFAAASHTHELTALAATGATNGHVLTANGSGGVSFAAASGGGVSAVNSTLADILSVSGSDLVADDLGADKLYGFDDSEGKAIGFTIGSGLSVSGDTLSATASGGSKTYATFTAEHNQPPAAAGTFATLDTRNSIAVLDFDAATDENAVFVGIMPEAASLGSGLIVRLHWMATSATSGNVRWGVQFERSNTDLDSDSFDTAVEATAAANGTSGIITTTAITVTTIDGITSGDVFRLKVFRNADDATNDTMTGDAELVAVEIRSAA